MTFIIWKGSNRAALAEMSRDILLACGNLDTELGGENRKADAGSRGPWLLMDEFQMNFDLYADILSRYIPISILTLA